MPEEELYEVTVRLIKPAWDAVEFSAALYGDTKTDAINRACQLYGYIEPERAVGARLALVYEKEKRWWHVRQRFRFTVLDYK